MNELIWIFIGVMGISMITTVVTAIYAVVTKRDVKLREQLRQINERRRKETELKSSTV